MMEAAIITIRITLLSSKLENTLTVYITYITMHLLTLLLSHLERGGKKGGEEKLSVLKQPLIHPPAQTAEGRNNSCVHATFFFIKNLNRIKRKKERKTQQL